MSRSRGICPAIIRPRLSRAMRVCEKCKTARSITEGGTHTDGLVGCLSPYRYTANLVPVVLKRWRDVAKNRSYTRAPNGTLSLIRPTRRRTCARARVIIARNLSGAAANPWRGEVQRLTSESIARIIYQRRSRAPVRAEIRNAVNQTCAVEQHRKR